MPIVVRRAVRALGLERAALKDEVERYGQDPQPGCPYLVENLAWRVAPRHTQRAHRRRLWQDVMLYARIVTVNVMDHLWAAQRLLDVTDELPLYAHMTVGRVVCEAAAKAAHLLDPTIDYETRLLRGAVVLLDDVDSRVKAAKALPGSLPVTPDALTEAERSSQALRNRIASAGITEVPGAHGRPAWLQFSDRNGRVPLKLQLISLVETSFPHRPNLYRHTSGVVHSAPWMLADAVTSTRMVPHLQLSPDILGIGATALTCLDAAGVLSGAYASYYGHDASAATTARQLRTRAMDVCMNEWFARQQLAAGR